jgi:hypothetical protein
MFGGILSLGIAAVTDEWSQSNGYAPAYRGEGWRRAWTCKPTHETKLRDARSVASRRCVDAAWLLVGADSHPAIEG